MTNINTHTAAPNPSVVRAQTMVAFVTGVVLTLIVSAVMLNAWTADAAVGEVGDTYVAIDPTRAYDGRIDTYAESGRLAPNQAKVISIKDGHDLTGKLVAQNAVPAGATSITYNLTVAGITGPNFVAVTSGDASSFLASAINFSGASIANAANVKIDANRQIKIWGGGNSGSMFVLIDITGYYLPAGATVPTDTTTTTTTTTTPPFDGSAVTLTDTTYEIQTLGDIPGQATESGTSSTFNKVRFSVSNGVVTGVPGDDGNSSNGKTSNVDPGSTFDSNTIKVTIAGGFNNPSSPTSIGSRWDFKVTAYNNGVITGDYARTDLPTDTGTFQMCATACSTDLPDPQHNIIAATDGPSPCQFNPPTSPTTFTVQFTGTTPGVAVPPTLSNNQFDIQFSADSSGAITGSNLNDNNNHTLPSGTVVCDSRTVTVMRNNGSSVTPSNVDNTWTLYNIVQNGTTFSGDYTSDVSTGVTGVLDVGTFTMTP